MTLSHSPYTGYLFTYFTGMEQTDDDEQVYFAISPDAHHWHDLRSYGDPVLRSCVGTRGIRDPYVVRDHNGGFYLLATDLNVHAILRHGPWTMDSKRNGSHSIVVWHSDDLVHWGEPWMLDVASAIPGGGYAWAPEAIWDPERKLYLLYWATISDEDNEFGDPQNMYLATTKDFHSISTPRKWIDRQDCCIDATMLRVGDWYYRATANEGRICLDRTKNPYAASIVPDFEDTRDAGEREWAFIGSLDDIFGQELNALCGGRSRSHDMEGPELFLLNDKDVHSHEKAMPFALIADRYAAHTGYTAFFSADLHSTAPSAWSHIDMDLGQLRKRHGSVLPITDGEYQALAAGIPR
ncbi:glycoside hydrolase family 43 protein [Bifidobacterium vansinderenii]|uniref:1,4-beta-xylanase n=1 Tax=Bifidobacterium vansinderenii TaxID=1984871 RepID=A0A229VW64_9BIFI|nr:glycoside hydrolase family 43 protein [Bifidobacterium vansinderenii]OXM99860.1 1,4-beta-xylanase [Bifidobacterium vansinderenii]